MCAAVTRVTDNALWAEVRERAAVHGWDDKARLLHEAAAHIFRRFRITDDEGRDVTRSRLDRLWDHNMADWGAY